MWIFLKKKNELHEGVAYVAEMAILGISSLYDITRIQN